MKETWTRRAKVALTGLAFVALFGVALQGLISTPQGLAVDTATVNVTATVPGHCKFIPNSPTTTLAFGTLDPTVGDNVTATTSVNFKCSKGVTYTITDNNGSNKSGTTHQMKHATLTEYIPYTFCYTTGAAIIPCDSDTPSVSGTGLGGGTTVTLNISGTVLGANYINVSPGSYSDTVTMTIEP
jgi:spore coat protein U-like protein